MSGSSFGLPRVIIYGVDIIKIFMLKFIQGLRT